MKNDFFSYLDGFDEITLIVPKKIDKENKTFQLLGENFVTPLLISEVISIGRETKYVCKINDTIFLNKAYVVVDESQNRSFLRIGKVVRTDLFDMMFSYDKHDLGVTYTKEKTTFKLWTPVAKEVEIELIRKDGSRQFIDLLYQSSGLWILTLFADLEGLKYRYRVRVNEKFTTTLDPYAISSTANGKYNYIVDPLKFRKFANPKPAFSGNITDAIIYEASVRDLTSSVTSKAVNKGKFKGLLEGYKSEGIPYISSLGVTHLQLMPIYDFEGVDELNPTKSYNWGYNPSQYNVVEGSFATDPEDPYNRINELIELIDYIHKNKMRVSMDVVYNHVYNMNTFPFESLVPGYYFRFDEKGIKTSASGCNNDIASEKIMVRNFIIQSIKHWMNTFNISAFRFDLMGLLDIKTMNKVEKEVKLIDSKALIYGEGWNINNILPQELRANMKNYALMPNIAFFNDKFRDTIKGGTFSKHLGYALGGKIKRSEIYYLFTGSAVDRYLFLSPAQSINYVECHDNHTFYDRAKILSPQLSEQQIKDYARLALGIVVLSQGVPFIHLGQSFLRSKKGVENSYKSSDEINQVDWELKHVHQDLVSTLKDLIKIRKTYKVFRLQTNAAILNQIKIALDAPYDKSIRFLLKDLNKTLTVFFKNDYQVEMLSPGRDYQLLFDSVKMVLIKENEILAEKPGVYIFIKE